MRLNAKSGMEEELSKFLREALPLANAEVGTNHWYAIQFDNSKYGIFETFSGESECNDHLNGKIAAGLMANASKLLRDTPKIEKLEVLANK